MNGVAEHKLGGNFRPLSNNKIRSFSNRVSISGSPASGVATPSNLNQL
jgi:hypothetical protein